MGTTLEQIESYFTSVEEFLSSSLTSVAPDLPHLHEIVNRIWADITRFGPPSLPKIPGLGSYEVPPIAPLPPPTPPTWSETATNWAAEHKWIVAGAGLGVIGTGILARYGVVRYRRHAHTKRKDMNKERREVVVILGADHPFGGPLALGLEAQGYIVIASVSTSDAVEVLESKSKGYIRVLVLDPHEPQTVQYFLRSLGSCLTLRFPTTTSGDPYLSSSTPLQARPYIHSLISLLSLFPTSKPGPLESLPLTESYLPHLIHNHVTPLRVIQSLLPLLRRGSRFAGEGTTRKSIIVCVPAIAARVGVPFAGEEAMIATATAKAVDVLRRELKIAATYNASDGVVAPKLVLVDVGAVALSRHRPTESPEHETESLMQSWSASEKMAYGAALESTLEQIQTTPRQPTHVNVFINALVGVVSGGARGRGYGYGYGYATEFGWGATGRLMLGMLGRVRTWYRGERFGIGAGATTYSFASYLPPVVLDYLLHIPHALIALRNVIAPALPDILPTQPTPHTQRLIGSAERFMPQPQPQTVTDTGNAKDADAESPDAVSEADLDSASLSGASEAGSGIGSGAISSSWVSLKDGPLSGTDSGKE